MSSTILAEKLIKLAFAFQDRIRIYRDMTLNLEAKWRHLPSFANEYPNSALMGFQNNQVQSLRNGTRHLVTATVTVSVPGPRLEHGSIKGGLALRSIFCICRFSKKLATRYVLLNGANLLHQRERQNYYANSQKVPLWEVYSRLKAKLFGPCSKIIKLCKSNGLRYEYQVLPSYTGYWSNYS